MSPDRTAVLAVGFLITSGSQDPAPNPHGAEMPRTGVEGGEEGERGEEREGENYVSQHAAPGKGAGTGSRLSFLGIRKKRE